VLIAKTRESLVDKVIGRVKSLHSYECPCVEAIPIVKGNPAYLQWIADETDTD
jgi:periplasmic divalent cation tolerance protein